MNIHSQDKRGCGLLSAVSFWAIAVALGVGTSYGQAPGTVRAQVHLPNQEMSKGLRILAILKASTAMPRPRVLRESDFNQTYGYYSYTFEGLRPGKYDFVLCDGLVYRAAPQTQTVKAGQTVTIDFLVEYQPIGQEKITNALVGTEGRLVGKDYPVFLRDPATGCTLARALTDLAGKYEFDGLPRGAAYQVDTEEADQKPTTLEKRMLQ